LGAGAVQQAIIIGFVASAGFKGANATISWPIVNIIDSLPNSAGILLAGGRICVFGLYMSMEPASYL
jgi:hypothetical protein